MPIGPLHLTNANNMTMDFGDISRRSPIIGIQRQQVLDSDDWAPATDIAEVYRHIIRVRQM